MIVQPLPRQLQLLMDGQTAGRGLCAQAEKSSF